MLSVLTILFLFFVDDVDSRSYNAAILPADHIDPDAVLAAAKDLPVEERVVLLDTLDALNGLPVQEHGLPDRMLSDLEERFVDTYANIPDVTRAAKQMGISGGKAVGMLADPPVGRAVRRELERRMLRSELTGDYIRSYIFGILELCPTDYFTVDEDGEWCIDPEKFRELPSEIKRYVDHVDIKVDKRAGTTRYSVKFVSKSQALALAAKYTLVEKHEVKTEVVPWAEIAGAVKELPAHETDDPIEKEIQAAGST